MIKVLRPGVHLNNKGKGYNNYLPIYSSTTLIKSGEKIILVDPGHIAERKKIQDLLGAEGVKPDEIDLVLITHHHLDHCSNMGSFPRAKIFLEGGYVSQNEPSYMVFRDLTLFNEGTGIEVVQTSGHTTDSVSYLYEEDGLNYMCVGDAVFEESIREGQFGGVADKVKYLESLEKIFNLADVIIPGHGEVIKDQRKGDLYKIIKQLTI